MVVHFDGVVQIRAYSVEYIIFASHEYLCAQEILSLIHCLQQRPGFRIMTSYLFPVLLAMDEKPRIGKTPVLDLYENRYELFFFFILKG